MKTRIEWIDICKAVAIFAMVFCHVWLELPKGARAFEPGHLLDIFIHYWHMPIFFVLSGLVFNNAKYGGWKNFSALLKSRARMILLPFIIFGIICGLYNWLFFFQEKEITVITVLQGLFIPNKYLFLYSFQWFLLSLFFTEIIFAVFNNISAGRKWLVAVLSVVWLAGGRILMNCTGWQLPLALDTTFYMVPVFATGVLGKDFFMEKRPLQSKWAQLVAFALLVVLFFFPWGKVNIKSCIYDPFPVYFFSIAVTLVVMMLIREQEGWLTNLKIYPAVRWMGRNSLALLLLNGSVRKSLPLKYLTLTNGAVSFCVQLLGTVVVIAIIYVLVFFLKKYTPLKKII